MSLNTDPKKKRKFGDDSEEQQNARPTRRKKVDLSVIPTYFAAPDYTWEAKKPAGGRRSTATLGPNSLRPMGTDANPKKPSGIKKAKQTYPNISFKAGHLLNAEFGGAGDNSANLTILTAKANKKHQGFDNNVKKALEKLTRLYEALSELYVDVRLLTYGISVEVAVSAGKWGDDVPDCYICKNLICAAATVNEPDVTALRDAEGNALSTSGQTVIKDLIRSIDGFINSANVYATIPNNQS